MAFKDILLTLSTHPDPTPNPAVAFAVGLAKRLEARVSAVLWELKLQKPGSFSLVADTLLDLPGLLRAEMRKSADNAQRLVQEFEVAARGAGVLGTSRIEPCAPVQIPDLLAERARLHDLTVVPILRDDDIGAMLAEAAIFGSGRPVLAVPEAAFGREVALDRAVIAWDFSRAAARAMADALPLLKAAGEVHAVTVINEKALKSPASSADLVGHLGAHGIKVRPITVDAAGRPIGETLQSYVHSVEADLMVMGAYGHSRIQEFILGGATRSMLDAPPVPVLLSH